MTGLSHVKLFATITDSSIWDQPDHVCKIWITMLSMADWHGCVYASLPGLANRARKTIAEVQEALEVFRSPDPYSRTPDHEGRRIVDIDGGWMLLNYRKHREARNAEALREQKRDWVARKRAMSKNVEDSRTTSNTSRKNDSVSVVSDLDLQSDLDPEGVQGEAPPAPEPPPPLPPAYDDEALGFEAPVIREVVHTLDGWEPSEELVAAALAGGLPREYFLDRVDDLRKGPIGGRRGVFRGKLDEYVRKLIPKWRTWYETAQAEQAEKATRRNGRPLPPPEVIRPTRKERQHAVRFDYDIDAIYDAVNAEGWVGRVGVDSARREAQRRMNAAARETHEKRAAGDG